MAPWSDCSPGFLTRGRMLSAPLGGRLREAAIPACVAPNRLGPAVAGPADQLLN
jgi:hypothetical protein